MVPMWYVGRKLSTKKRNVAHFWQSYHDRYGFLANLCCDLNIRSDIHMTIQSWPMHDTKVSTNYSLDEDGNMTPPPLGNVQARYERYMQGCRDQLAPQNQSHLCDEWEGDRIEQINEQPGITMYFTDEPYGKGKLPGHLLQMLQQFWENNKEKQKLEYWEPGDIYANHWESPTYMLTVGDPQLTGGGYALHQHVVNEVRPFLETWTGQRQVETNLYGIRVYKSNAILVPHLQNFPFVSSCMINVAQDVDKPWCVRVDKE